MRYTVISFARYVRERLGSNLGEVEKSLELLEILVWDRDLEVLYFEIAFEWRHDGL